MISYNNTHQQNNEGDSAKFSATSQKFSSNTHYLLFTGHMIDRADRPLPRFPASKESAVKAAIKEAVAKEKEQNGTLKGIAGGACGGDILFHEVCKALGIETKLFLALPREAFIAQSVAFAGAGWVERFDRLYKSLPVKVLSAEEDLSQWRPNNGNFSIWEKNNLWMLKAALAAGENMLLIALWDGKGGDNVGGTEHMVQQATALGANTIIVDINAVK